MSSTEAASATKSTPQELTSILSQVQNLQTDRERLMKELEEAKEKMSKLQVQPDASRVFFMLPSWQSLNALF